MKVPIDRQAAAIELAVKEALARGLVPDAEAAMAGVVTMKWCEKNPDAVRYAARIVKERAVKMVLEAFPGAEIG